MKKLILALTLIAGAAFGQNMDSRQGDSLALVAIKKANPGSLIDTLTGAKAWKDGNPISSWYGVTLTSGRVGSLSFWGFNLTTIPTSIGNFTNLTSLSLWSNRLIAFPAELGKLTNLTALDLSNNLLKAVPVEIGNCKKLTALSLWSNNLLSIPSTIGNLTNLTSLELYSNQLGTLPVEIGNLTNLTSLAVYSNQLRTLPKEIGKLTNLIGLTLDKNHLTSLPIEIGKLTNLTGLSLETNYLTDIPVEIGNCKQMTHLYLGSNQLKSIPDEIGNFTNLKVLHLDNNRMTALPSTIGNCTNLNEFNISSNLLMTLPIAITSLSQLYSGYGLNVRTNHLFSQNLAASVDSWLTMYQSNWQTEQTDFISMTKAFSQSTLVNTSLTITPAMTNGLCGNGVLKIIANSGKNYTVSGCTITPITGFIGTLTVPVYAVSSTNSTGAVNMEITVRPSNYAPTMSSATMQKIGKGTFAILPSMTDAKDLDGDNLTVLTFPGNGYTNSCNTITPNAGYSGSLIVPIAVTDGVATSAVINMIVTVDPALAITDSPIKSVAPLTATFSQTSLRLNTNLPAGTTDRLFDLAGRQIFAGSVAGSSVNVGSIGSGVYVVRIGDGSKVSTMKIVAR